MKKLASIAAGLAVIPMLAFVAAPVFADSPGQLQGGANTYVVKNVTQNGSYGSTATANTCDDVLEYSVELHNTEFGLLSNIVVSASLPSASSTSHVSNMTATTAAGGTTGTDGSVTVTTNPARSINYISGSTQLFNGQGAVVKTLPDGITTGGVNVGNLNGSTTEFVNFKAKVTCETKPVTPSYTCDLLSITKGDNRTVTVNEFKYTVANGATFKNVTLNWGDNSAAVTDSSIIGKNHTYAKDGSYTVSAVAHFTANGKDVSADGASCAQPVSFTTPPQTPPTTPPATPEKPTTLVNTGPGDVAAVFGITSIVGAVAYRLFLGRKLGQQS